MVIQSLLGVMMVFAISKIALAQKSIGTPLPVRPPTINTEDHKAVMTTLSIPQRRLWWASLLLLLTSCEAKIRFRLLRCPQEDGKTNTFSLTALTQVTIKRYSSAGSLCTLGVEQEDGTIKPIARSYDGNSWERAGGAYASGLGDWDCSGFRGCKTRLPKGSKYVLHTRTAPDFKLFRGRFIPFLRPKEPEKTVTKGEIARFLESASFGATPSDLNNWGSKTFESYLKEQFAVEPTYHREHFRRRANPRWPLHHPEFAANLDPCAAGSTWRRVLFSIKDSGRTLFSRRVSDRWEITMDGYVRALLVQLRFQNANAVNKWEITDGGSYRFCSSDEEMRRGIYRMTVLGVCRPLVADDVIIDFPPGYVPPGAMQSTLAAVTNTDAWEGLARTTTDWVMKTALDPTVCVNLVPQPVVENVTRATFPYSPIFARTEDGIWLQHDPRIQMRENSPTLPLEDGGAEYWMANKTWWCSNVARSFLNEATCVVSSRPACRAGSSDRTAVTTGVLLCGSPGEVANSLAQGETGLDVHSITVARSSETFRSTGIRLPVSTSSRDAFSRQRETVWGDVSLNAPDQLRQRMALALVHIMSVPKIAISQQEHHTESFLSFYDILVRHAFGNYRDVLREIIYSPLMAESLTFVNSKAVSATISRAKVVIYPDENFSREIMQLFTIGLFELNMDGSMVLDANKKPIDTYDTDDIMSFARAWTGFERSPKRANVEAVDGDNRVDPLRIVPTSRDRFPKSDLLNGYIGDNYPLCEDLPDKPFLRVGAKYMLLGTSPAPELLYKDDWKVTGVEKRLRVQPGVSGLYEKLSSFPTVLVLDQNLACPSATDECSVDMVRVVLVDTMYYEYVRQPCVEYPFYPNAHKIAGSSRNAQPMCANPVLPVASESCCDSRTSGLPQCMFAGERMKRDTAQSRCESVGKTICDYRNFTASAECPHVGYRWTSLGCKIRVKVRDDGQVAVVHDFSNGPSLVTASTQNFFIAHWTDKKFPTVANACNGGVCDQVEGYCICDVNITNAPVFTSLPSKSDEILDKLRVGHATSKMYDANKFVAKTDKGYTHYSSSQSCCGSDTFFEVEDSIGQSRFLKNVKSTVIVAGTTLQFRNPPQFNSVILPEFSIADSAYETEALLDHLFYHKNTAPFLAYRFIQRFGVANPSPRYILSVATAFRDGVYSSFGTGKYGDLQATLAAVLLDREARSTILDNDPSHGSMREPILKVLGFMRAMEFKSSEALVALDSMEVKVGQMPYEQESVFSFFRPQYSPFELVKLGLTAAESEVMSSGRIVGLLNGLFSLVKRGLVKCEDGFGVYGECSSTNSSGVLAYQPSDATDYKSVISGLSELLTGGRLGETKAGLIHTAVSTEKDPKKAMQMAMQLIVSTPEFHSTNRLDPRPPKILPATPPVAPIQNPGYKVVIHLALVGGCDSFNMLTPSESCALYPEYKLIRGNVGVNSTIVLPLSGTGGTPQPCDSFDVHKALPFVQQLYNDQDLLFMANVGVLTEPCSKANCQIKTETPLFAHNSMQDEVNSLDPFNVAAGTAPMGRMADALQATGYATGRTAVQSTPASLGGRSIIAPAIVTLDQTGAKPFIAPNMTQVIGQLNGGEGTKSGIYGEIWSSLLRRSLVQSEDLVTLLASTPTQTVFPDTSLGKRLKLIAQLIADRNDRGVNRDFFFVPFDGFDMHGEVMISLQSKFVELNDALEDFVNELKLLGVWDDVVIVQTSDFGRTLTENSSGGTDHGWGGNYFMAGGSVKGQRIVGSYPSTLGEEGESSWDRGRFIPSTPWDSVFNSVADWVGVKAETDLNAVLPNRKKFPSLFSASDLFN